MCDFLLCTIPLPDYKIKAAPFHQENKKKVEGIIHIFSGKDCSLVARLVRTTPAVSFQIIIST